MHPAYGPSPDVPKTVPGALKSGVAVCLAAVLLTLAEAALLVSGYDWLARSSLDEAAYGQGESTLMNGVRENLVTVIGLHLLIALLLIAGAIWLLRGGSGARILIWTGGGLLVFINGCSAAGLGIIILAIGRLEIDAAAGAPTTVLNLATVTDLVAVLCVIVAMVLIGLPSVGRFLRTVPRI